jgi:peptide deformylase
MSILPIVAWPDPRLKRICGTVDVIDGAVQQLVSDMFETMYGANGRGLAAPQVGVMQRLFVMDVTWKEGVKAPLVCFNPEINALGDQLSTNEEACLSIVGVSADVTRANQIELTFTDLNGERASMVLEGFAAICAQHELDHLNGRVIFDHLDTAARASLETKYRTLA